jgi:hypothetical protein
MKKTMMVLIAAAFTTGVAVAGEKMGYKSWDADGDGVISAEEAEKSMELTESWKEVDTNNDGVVDESEFSAFETMQTMEPEQKN